MKHLILAFALLATPAHAEDTLFSKEIIVWPHELARRTPLPADVAALEAELVVSVMDASNRQRALVGLSPLTNDAVLAAAAARYSRRMLDEGFFSHIAPDGERLDRRLPPGALDRYSRLGENLWSAEGAVDWQASVIADEAAANWVESPTHRDNLLDSGYTLGGVGIAIVGEKVAITMLYARPHDFLEQSGLM